MDSSMMQNENEEARQSIGSKRKQPSEEVANDAESPDQGVRKKPRFIWATDVHNLFLDAVNKLGYKKAVPTKILALMKVEGLTRENVASHLQKYRLYHRKNHREMQKGRALPNESRKNCGSFTSGISGKSRRSCVLPNTRAMQASGQCACCVLPQPVTPLLNQFGVYPAFQGISHTPPNDMLSENGFQGISGGGLEHGFYDSNGLLYDYNGLEINGPLPPYPLVDSYGDSFLPQLDNLSIAYRGVTSPSVNRNMENFGGVVHSPRLLGGGVEHFPRPGGLDGGLLNSPRPSELDGGLVHSPRPGRLGRVMNFLRPGGLVNQPRGGGLDGEVMHSPRRGRFHGGAVRGMIGPQGAAHSPVEAQRLGGEAMHGPVELPGLGGEDVYYPLEASGLGWGAARCPVEEPVLAGEGVVQCPGEGPELGGGTMNDAPGLAGGSLNHHPVDEPGLSGGDTYRQADATELSRSDAQENNPIFDAQDEFFSFDEDRMNFIQEELEDTGIDGLFR